MRTCCSCASSVPRWNRRRRLLFRSGVKLLVSKSNAGAETVANILREGLSHQIAITTDLASLPTARGRRNSNFAIFDDVIEFGNDVLEFGNDLLGLGSHRSGYGDRTARRLHTTVASTYTVCITGTVAGLAAA